MEYKNIEKITTFGLIWGYKMNLNIKIIDVKALDNFILHVVFNNGIKKSYDVKQLFYRFPDMFEPFKYNPAIFKNVKIDCGGCGISWNEDIDISEFELWENGKIIK